MRHALLLAFIVLLGCGGRRSPTEPLHCSTTTVFAAERFYLERSEPETESSGRLERRDVSTTPNGRDHHYFLNNTAVYSGGPETEPVFKAAAGSNVIIHGKLVDVGFGPEIWTARITSCR